MKTKWLLGMALMAWACGGGGGGLDDAGNEPGTPLPAPGTTESKKIAIALSCNIVSRATETAFETNDAVGLYVVNYSGGTAGTLAASGNHVNNMKFTYTNAAWKPTSEIYWKDDETKADFYCYYPYAASPAVGGHAVTVPADQSTEANYKQGDLLWGKTAGVSPTTSKVGITLKHLFACVQVKLEPGDGFTAASLAAASASVQLKRLKMKGTVNLGTGSVTVSGEEQAVTPYWDGTYYKAIVVPQTVAEGPFVVVTIDGKEYTLVKGLTLEPNKRYTFSVKVSKTSNGINVSIGSWDEVQFDGVAE